MKQDTRPHNLSVKQKFIQDYQPANDGWPEPLTDPSDRLTIGVTDGKSGSSSTKNVTSYSKAEGELK